MKYRWIASLPTHELKRLDAETIRYNNAVNDLYGHMPAQPPPLTHDQWLDLRGELLRREKLQ